jgi:hypothetical protein
LNGETFRRTRCHNPADIVQALPILFILPIYEIPFGETSKTKLNSFAWKMMNEN